MLRDNAPGIPHCPSLLCCCRYSEKFNGAVYLRGLWNNDHGPNGGEYRNVPFCYAGYWVDTALFQLRGQFDHHDVYGDGDRIGYPKANITKLVTHVVRWRVE